MSCPTCGQELPQGALYCPECGARTFEPPPQPQTAVAFPQLEETRSPLGGKKGLLFTVIVVLVIILVGVTIEAGMLGSGGAPAVNSPGDPLSGQQLHQAFSPNGSPSGVSYANKTVYVEDTVDFGVRVDSAGQHFSTVNSGSVVLIWNDQAPVSQLSTGDTVLAKCLVVGPVRASGGGYLVYLRDCDLVRTLSKTTTSSGTVSVANL